MALWWSPAGYAEGENPLSEDFGFTSQAFTDAGYSSCLLHGDYDDDVYVRTWYGNGHVVVEIPWIQFFVTKNHLDVFFATLFRELVRDYMLSEQTRMLRRVAAMAENLQAVKESIDMLSADLCSELSDISVDVAKGKRES